MHGGSAAVWEHAQQTAVSNPGTQYRVARPAGHSLGGAVAQLCALDLLQAAGAGAPPDVSCVGFATPAVGNAALAAHIAARGWDRRFVTYLLPGDSCVAVKSSDELHLLPSECGDVSSTTLSPARCLNAPLASLASWHTAGTATLSLVSCQVTRMTLHAHPITQACLPAALRNTHKALQAGWSNMLSITQRTSTQPRDACKGCDWGVLQPRLACSPRVPEVGANGGAHHACGY